MASTRHELWLTQKEVERAARAQDLHEAPRRAALERARENDAPGTEKPTGGAEARDSDARSRAEEGESGYSFSQNALFDPATKRLNRVRER
jgi:hypothetical protein